MFDLAIYRDALGAWFEKVASDLDEGRFRYSTEGSLIPIEGNAAFFSTCFALKAAWNCGLHFKWPAERVKGGLEFLASNQREDGYFADPFLADVPVPTWKTYIAAILRLCEWPVPARIQRERNLRADTRQIASVLLEYGHKLRYPLPAGLTSPDKAVEYFHSLDWTTPWGCASHLSHEMFFLSVNNRMFRNVDDYESVVNAVCGCLATIQRDDGCWYEGDIPDNMKINGAMKVFSMLNWLDRPFPDSSALMRFALSQPFESDGCGFLNRLYVVWNASRGCDSTKYCHQINTLVADSVAHLQRFIRDDGGFSFFPDRAESSYFGCQVTCGLPESDMHGAVMFTWALAMCVDLAPELFQHRSGWKPMHT
ncbi:hypothetical protein [Desulfogranum mediterraneum]|uniref:hypothetical protein n=1 Tax=Desulfogranum mediterraneum TaxID=160661 RepID=UPI0003FE8348|nr:hypothetical protein [Desulfogranum mediterraneum]